MCINHTTKLINLFVQKQCLWKFYHFNDIRCFLRQNITHLLVGFPLCCSFLSLIFNHRLNEAKIMSLSHLVWWITSYLPFFFIAQQHGWYSSGWFSPDFSPIRMLSCLEHYLVSSRWQVLKINSGNVCGRLWLCFDFQMENSTWIKSNISAVKSVFVLSAVVHIVHMFG